MRIELVCLVLFARHDASIQVDVVVVIHSQVAELQFFTGVAVAIQLFGEVLRGVVGVDVHVVLPGVLDTETYWEPDLLSGVQIRNIRLKKNLLVVISRAEGLLTSTC